QQMAPQFMRLSDVRVLTVALPDSAAATQLAAHGMHGAGTLREVVAMAAPGARVQDQKITYPSADPIWQGLQGQFLSMSPGEYAGPYQTAGGWMVLQVVSKSQSPQPFEELPAMVIQHLQNQLLEQKRELRIQALTDSLRHAIPVEEHLDRLARVSWFTGST